MTLTPSETMQFVSLMIVVLTFAISTYSNIKNRGENQARTDAKLDNIDGKLNDVSATLKEVNRKLDDHSQTLVRHTEQLSTVFRRLAWVEEVLGKHATDNMYGGTD